MMILTDKQRAALTLFANGALLSAQALVKAIPGTIKVEALNRIAELRDKGALKKMNQTQYGITKKGLEALGLLPDEKPVTRVELEDDDTRPMTDAEMDRLLDGAVEDLAEDSIATLAALDVEIPDLKPVTSYEGTVFMPDGNFSGGGAIAFAFNRELTGDEAASLAVASKAPEVHPALVAIEQLKDQLTKQKPLHIDKLELKKEALAALGRILAQDICDLLVEIADDLDRAAGNEI